MVSHARDELPNECCGLLVGSPGEIVRAERARNLQSSPTRFLVDPSAHFAAIKRAREAGLAVTGAYHSHPRTAAWPSATDVAEIVDTDLLHVIVSLADRPAGPDVRAFRFQDGNFQPIEIVLVG
jgi:proteasome lid subunit RPN8/RPN11